jgi:hypothetical protein
VEDAIASVLFFLGFGCRLLCGFYLSIFVCSPLSRLSISSGAIPLIFKSIKSEYPTITPMDRIEMNEAYLVHEISGHILEFVACLEHSKVDPKTLVRISSSSILIQGIPKYNNIGD